jgi:uncharacterized protein with HEPN domain
MKKERDTLLYLHDMLTGINRIIEYTTSMTYDAFFFDNKTIDAVLRNLEVIGEASNKVATEVKEKHPDFPWDQMYFMRNKMIHEYFGIDLEIIWDIIQHHLPQNRIELIEIINQEI